MKWFKKLAQLFDIEYRSSKSHYKFNTEAKKKNFIKTVPTEERAVAIVNPLNMGEKKKKKKRVLLLCRTDGTN